MKVLLAEPWWGGSHRQWAEGYRNHSSYEVRVISRPGTHWRRRMKTAGEELAAEANQIITRGWTPDVILATDMMDLATFRKRLNTRLPTILYMHENQLTYGATIDINHGRINARSVAAADLTVFNSQYHWSSFGEALMALDHPLALAAWHSATIIPVGMDLSEVRLGETQDGPANVVWNHRWEPDKAPDRFADALDVIDNLDWSLTLLGERDRSAAIDRIRSRFSDRIVHDGWAEPRQYLDLLGRGTIVVSTANQEFFGVSVAEAVASGCFPIVPNRLAYPELLGSPLVDGTLYEGDLGPHLRWAIEHPEALRMGREVLAARMQRYDWSTIAPMMDLALTSI
ncbi:MAG: DUF3524 domain-containing protein [Acidimicrobiia bacterium]|nr:DUF3524 domain-containing protein [Acidimicrobiia bacterium]NNL27373.1 DUF3524 domain-containing protein [Acidimicrobiia bacterium]